MRTASDVMTNIGSVISSVQQAEEGRGVVQVCIEVPSQYDVPLDVHQPAQQSLKQSFAGRRIIDISIPDRSFGCKFTFYIF